METYLILGVIFLAAFGLLALQNAGGRTLTGRATVVSRRVDVAKVSGGRYSGGGWNYLVTFRLSDGEEIELYTFENEYKQLTEGLTGQLTWHKDSLSSFEPDKED